MLLVVGKIGSANMMRNLEIERIALASIALSIARRWMDEMIKYYSKERRAFGQATIEFGQIHTQNLRELCYPADLFAPWFADFSNCGKDYCTLIGQISAAILW